jgi:glycosyltransferase involved in cell wall biosynthesis
MKIVCISASEVPSAKANSIQALKTCQSLALLGHTLTLLVPTHATRNTEYNLASFYGLTASFPIEWLPADPRLKRYDFSWMAVQRARALKADVVYAWPLQAALLAALGRMPTLLELHGPPEGKLGPWLFRLFLRAPAPKRLLPITQALANLLAAEYGIRLPGRVVISPNGVDLARYRDLPAPAEARRALNLPEKPTIGYTGHLYPGRGMKLLVDLARRFPEMHFLWVGGRPNEIDAWKAWIKAEKAANITLTGFIENQRLPRYQAAADILLMPYEQAISGSSGGNSASYASPMKMFEYMACGRAIISSDLPVIREVLNRTNAVLCPPENADAWAQALSDLLADPARQATLAGRARHDVTQYTWEARARKALEGFGKQ